MNIKQYPMKCHSSDSIPGEWLFTCLTEKGFDWQRATYKSGQWDFSLPSGKDQQTMLECFPVKPVKRQVTVVGWRMYETLCQQGLYWQLRTGDARLPVGNGKKNKGQLSGMLAFGKPTLIDVLLNGNNLQCIDLDNFGLEQEFTLQSTINAIKDRVRMIECLEMGSWAGTAAAQAVNRFKRHDLDRRSVYCHQVAEVRALERLAYYGGRCEGYRLGKINESIWNLDVKAMYAFFALTKKFPCRLWDYGVGIDDRTLKQYLDYGFHVCATVVVNTDLNCFPLRHNDNTIYPVGSFITTLSGPEFALALQMGCIAEIRQWACYQCDYVLRKNAEWFFAAKEKLTEAGLPHLIPSLKAMQNPMYGNIGKRGRQWIDYPPRTDVAWGQWWTMHPEKQMPCVARAIQGRHQYLDSGLEPEYSNPAISNTMAGYGRVHMWKMMCLAGHGNYIYNDTDGLQCTLAGACNLHLEWDWPSNEPGQLALKWYSDDVEIRGLKFYRHDDEWVQAGAPGHATRHADGSCEWFEHMPFSLSQWKKQPFMSQMVRKELPARQAFRHGLVGKDGTVSPFRMTVRENPDTGEMENVIL